jgi:hypothetical protein
MLGFKVKLSEKTVLLSVLSNSQSSIKKAAQPFWFMPLFL